MRRQVFTWMAAFFISLATVQQARAITLNDIDFWVGSGSNQAALVFDWNDGKPSLIWGYQWDGVVTAEQMFLDVAAADPRLYAKLSSFVWGTAIIGVGYDRDGDGFALSDGTTFVDGVSVGATSDGVVAVDGDDSYVEGWNTGFWALYLADANPYLGDVWDSAQTGVRDTVLTDDAFFGFSFAPFFTGDAPLEVPVPATSPTQSNAIPEPASLLMLGMAALATLVRRRDVNG